MYVQVAWKEEKAVAVFIHCGKTPNCFNSEAEAIGRLCSLVFRLGGSLKDIYEQLNGIQCEPHWSNGYYIKSPADGVAKALRQAEKDGPLCITTGVNQQTNEKDTI